MYNHLKDYYNDFNIIFTSVITLIEDINKNITAISPVFQLFAISIQELDNANAMVKKYLTVNKEQRERKIAELFFAAYKFVSIWSHWRAIIGLANYILLSDKSIIECEEAMNVLDRHL